MFTGLVETIGRVREITPAPGGQGKRLLIDFSGVDWELKQGESVNTNGVCLTASVAAPGHFAADVMPETLKRSAIGDLKPGSRVHLERALRPDGRLGGHIVQGHVDGVGVVRDLVPEGNARILSIQAAPDLMLYLVEKGSIAVDGVSLTVAGKEPDSFSVSLVAHTLKFTCLGELRSGGKVNLEVDIIGKYVYNFLKSMAPGQGKGLTMDLLKKFDYI